MQERHNSIANALELRLSCTNPPVWFPLFSEFTQSSLRCLYYSVTRVEDCSIGALVGSYGALYHVIYGSLAVYMVYGDAGRDI